jgi:hypothetical protein
MVRVMAFALVGLLALQETLTYRPAPGQPKPVTSEFTYNFDITGPAALVGQLINSNPVLSIKEIRATRTGKLSVTAGANNTSHVELTFEKAHVNGLNGDKPFEVDLDSTTSLTPQDLTSAQQAPRILSFVLSMGKRDFLLGPQGEYSLVDTKQDAQDEATGTIVDAPVRLPAHAVSVGEQWTSEWIGNVAHKKNGGKFHYKQTARLAEIVPGPAPRARITFATTGALDIPAGKNPQNEETVLDAKGFILLDLQTGTVVASESAGTVTTDMKGASLKMVLRATAKFQTP